MRSGAGQRVKRRWGINLYGVQHTAAADHCWVSSLKFRSSFPSSFRCLLSLTTLVFLYCEFLSYSQFSAFEFHWVGYFQVILQRLPTLTSSGQMVDSCSWITLAQASVREIVRYKSFVERLGLKAKRYQSRPSDDDVDAGTNLIWPGKALVLKLFISHIFEPLKNLQSNLPCHTFQVLTRCSEFFNSSLVPAM